jgi:hypothetical protein
MKTATQECKYCGSARIALVPKRQKNGLVQSKRVCLDCRRSLGFAPLPWSRERAANFVLPWGKYRGRSVGELTKTYDGRDYLAWLCKNVAGNAAIAASIALGKLQLGDEIVS